MHLNAAVLTVAKKLPESSEVAGSRHFFIDLNTRHLEDLSTSECTQASQILLRND